MNRAINGIREAWLGVINELTSVMSAYYKQQVEKQSQQQKVLRSKGGGAMEPTSAVTWLLSGCWRGQAQLPISGALGGGPSRIHRTIGEQHASLWEPGRKEGLKKNAIHLLAAKQQSSG